MSTHRPDRVGELIHGEIMRLLREEMADPRVVGATVLRVKVTPDLRSARLWVVPLGGEGDRQALLKGLRRAAGFLRTRLGQTLRLRHTPALEFSLDDALDDAVRLTNLLGSLAPALSGVGEAGDTQALDGEE